MNERKVLNNYKLVLLIVSYFESGKTTNNHAQLSKVEVKLNNALIRRATYDKIIKAKNFSDIDDTSLKLFRTAVSDWARSKSLKIDELATILAVCIENEILPNEDINLLKKLGLRNLFSEIEKKQNSSKSIKEIVSKEIAKIIPNQNFLNAMMKNFKEDLDAEVEAREKEISKLGIRKNLSNDDSILIAFNKKMSKCKSFEDVEDLLLSYTTSHGCDLINGFLRGNLSTVKSNEPNLKLSWGNSSNVSFSVLLDGAIKALELRKVLMYGKLDSITTVYRGLNIEGLLKFIGIEKEKLIDKYNGKNLSEKGMIVNYINKEHPLYQTKAITSTTLNPQTAQLHAKRSPQSKVFMKIELQKGTAFGKDFRNTTFGSDDYNEEVILKPMQKIRLKSATLMGDWVSIQCVTE